MHAGNVQTYDDPKHGCEHNEAVNRIQVYLKTQRDGIPVSRFGPEDTIEGFPISNKASALIKAIVANLKVHAAVNVVKLIMQILLVLQTAPFLGLGLVIWLYFPLSLNG